MKKGIVGQMFGLFRIKLVVALFEMVVGFSVVAAVQDHAILGAVVAALFLLFEFSQLYSAAFEAAEHDRRSYSGNKVFPWKGILLPIVILVFSLILFACYLYAWKTAGGSEGLQTVKSVVLNVPFVLWTIIYDPFLKLNLGTFRMAGLVFFFLFPFVASGLGYYAGYRDFSITEKFMPFVYDRKKKK